MFTVEEIKRKMEQYCVYQDRCHKEVEQKLYDFSLIPLAREEILMHLLQHDFLNETRFAKSFARGKFNQKGWGILRITNELTFREISAYNIKEALKEINPEDYHAKIYHLAERRNETYSETDLYKRKKKLTDFLLRKGFEYPLIKKVLEDLFNS